MRNFLIRAVLPTSAENFEMVVESVEADGYHVDAQRDLCFYKILGGKKMNAATFKEAHWFYVLEATL